MQVELYGEVLDVRFDGLCYGDIWVGVIYIIVIFVRVCIPEVRVCVDTCAVFWGILGWL